MNNKDHCLFIGVSGGSGSGKTSICDIIDNEFDTTVISQDNYYIPPKDSKTHDFDHPDAIDRDLFLNTIGKLKNGEDNVTKPNYNFSTRKREGTLPIKKAKVYILEGILLFCDKSIRDELDIKVFVDAPDDTRLIRRIRRDLKERGRDLENILEQYEKFVRPGYVNFTQPTKRYADIIIPNGADGVNEIATEMLISTIKHKM